MCNVTCEPISFTSNLRCNVLSGFFTSAQMAELIFHEKDPSPSGNNTSVSGNHVVSPMITKTTSEDSFSSHIETKQNISLVESLYEGRIDLLRTYMQMAYVALNVKFEIVGNDENSKLTEKMFKMTLHGALAVDAAYVRDKNPLYHEQKKKQRSTSIKHLTATVSHASIPDATFTGINIKSEVDVEDGTNRRVDLMICDDVQSVTVLFELKNIPLVDTEYVLKSRIKDIGTEYLATHRASSHAPRIDKIQTAIHTIRAMGLIKLGTVSFRQWTTAPPPTPVSRTIRHPPSSNPIAQSRRRLTPASPSPASPPLPPVSPIEPEEITMISISRYTKDIVWKQLLQYYDALKIARHPCLGKYDKDNHHTHKVVLVVAIMVAGNVYAEIRSIPSSVELLSSLPSS